MEGVDPKRIRRRKAGEFRGWNLLGSIHISSIDEYDKKYPFEPKLTLSMPGLSEAQKRSFIQLQTESENVRPKPGAIIRSLRWACGGQSALADVLQLPSCFGALRPPPLQRRGISASPTFTPVRLLGLAARDPLNHPPRRQGRPRLFPHQRGPAGQRPRPRRHHVAIDIGSKRWRSPTRLRCYHRAGEDHHDHPHRRRLRRNPPPSRQLANKPERLTTVTPPTQGPPGKTCRSCGATQAYIVDRRCWLCPRCGTSTAP